MSKTFLKHSLAAFTTLSVIIFVSYELGAFNTFEVDFNGENGYFYLFVYLLKCMQILLFPLNIFQLFCSLFYNDGHKRVLRSIPKSTRFTICFRIVTRGDYPDLVHTNVTDLLALLDRHRVHDFIIQAVCNKSIRLTEVVKHPRVSELIVPDNYTTKNNTKFKARNLQYALDYDPNGLNDHDWIVHLDEESQITESSLYGILSFINEGKHHIGQGMITYGRIRAVNYLNTMVESLRVGGFYLASSRFCMRTFHKPLVLFNGSFIVCRVDVEKALSFDFGPKGSITEDAYFAIKAVNMGYSFDWIEGVVNEESPMTFWDFVRQRKRWIYGLHLLYSSADLKKDLNYFFFRLHYVAWMSVPFQLLSRILLLFFPISLCLLDSVLPIVSLSITFYLFAFGMTYNFNWSNKSLFFKLFSFLGIIVWIHYNIFAETVAICWLVFFKNELNFYVVDKSKKIKQDFIV